MLRICTLKTSQAAQIAGQSIADLYERRKFVPFNESTRSLKLNYLFLQDEILLKEGFHFAIKINNSTQTGQNFTSLLLFKYIKTLFLFRDWIISWLMTTVNDASVLILNILR